MSGMIPLRWLERRDRSGLWVPLDKNEGVVKAHELCAVFSAPRDRQSG